MNGCVDDGNVTIDFRAVFKGVNVGGIDGQYLSQVSCPKSITHCKPLRKQKSVQKLVQSPGDDSYSGIHLNQSEQGILEEANCV